MKREELRGIVDGITDEQLDAIMKLNGNSINAEKSKANDLRKLLDEANERINALSEDNEAKQKASMSLEDRIKAMEESYAAKEKALAIEKNTLAAEKIFSSAGLVTDDYSALMSFIVTDNLDTTTANAEAIAKLVSAQRESAVSNAKQEWLKSTPSPGGASAPNAGMTKKDFDDMSYTERVKLFNESPEVYEQLKAE